MATLQCCCGLCHVREHACINYLLCARHWVYIGEPTAKKKKKKYINLCPYEAFILVQTHALKNIVKYVPGEK